MLYNRSQSDQKRSILINRLSILILVLTSIYFFLDWWWGIHSEPLIYIGFFSFAILIFFLNQLGKAEPAKAIGLIAFNAMIFLVSSSEPYAAGVHLYFFAAGAVALTIYDYRDWPKSSFFAVLSMVLNIMVYLGGFSILEHRNISDEHAKVFFIINGLVNGAVCIYSFLLFSKLNYDAEKILEEKEKIMLEQNDQLIKTNKELDRFVYSVSHDLRAPLSSMSGLIQLVEKSHDTMETNQYLGLMKGRIAKLEQFIRDIIDFSRNARSEIRLEKVDLKDLVRETFESLKFISGAESMILQDDSQIAEPLSIDKTRFQIVLFNLISNSIRYRNPYTNPCYIKLNSKLINSKLSLQIEDNGIGIHPTHHAKVFDMFYRASENSKGSGLGLYIVKETVERLGGTIELHSVPGEGTRFTLELPIKSS